MSQSDSSVVYKYSSNSKKRRADQQLQRDEMSKIESGGILNINGKKEVTT